MKNSINRVYHLISVVSSGLFLRWRSHSSSLSCLICLVVSSGTAAAAAKAHGHHDDPETHDQIRIILIGAVIADPCIFRVGVKGNGSI